MQVILKKDVERLGGVGDIVRVKPGYARNYLLPAGIAAHATPHNIRHAEILRKRAETAAEARTRTLRRLADQLEGASCTTTARANEEGHLFGSVARSQIAEALAAEGFAVDEQMVQLDEPIRELGVYEVPLRVSADLSATCKVWVVADE